MAGFCSDIEETDGRNRVKGLLKVMLCLVTVGREMILHWDWVLSVRPEMMEGDSGTWRKRHKQV